MAAPIPNPAARQYPMDQATRNSLRRKILAQRDSLSQVERQQKSQAIHELLWTLPTFCNAATLLAYVNFRSEVETLPLITAWLARGRELCVPLTDPGSHRLIPYLLTDPVCQLRPGYCGIPEPDPARCQAIDPARIDAVLVPGSVFDRQGGRLGYGGGYYDRFLADEAPQAVRIGIAFELQVVAAVPLLPHDQPLQFLVTETGVAAR